MKSQSTTSITGIPLRTANARGLKTTNAELDLTNSLMRFGYEPDHVQQYSFFAALLMAFGLALFLGAAVGGFGMVLLYFLVYSFAAGMCVRKVEFSLPDQKIITDKVSGAFGFSVRKNGKEYFLGFKAAPHLIDTIAAKARSYQEGDLVRQRSAIYPIAALLCGALVGGIGKHLAGLPS